MRLTEPQRKVIEFMQRGYEVHLNLYEYGLYSPYIGVRCVMEKPKVTIRTLDALVALGLLDEVNGEAVLTQKGKEWKCHATD